MSLLSTLTIGAVNSHTFQETSCIRTLRAPATGRFSCLKLNGAAVIPTPCTLNFVEFVDTIVSTQEHTVDCSATHKAVYSIGRTVYEPPREILLSPILVELAFSTSFQNPRLKVSSWTTALLSPRKVSCAWKRSCLNSPSTS